MRLARNKVASTDGTQGRALDFHEHAGVWGLLGDLPFSFHKPNSLFQP